jgi:hypothetical protein
MQTDLYGNPLGKQPAFELSLHQKHQATLLHHWTSKTYLEGLLSLIDALMKGADLNLELARIQGRDELIANPQWGVRDTAANWGSMAGPTLEDFRRSTIKLIAWRATDLYCGTGRTQCGRMLGELSPYWMTPDEKAWFDEQWNKISAYASRLDEAVGAGTERPLRDMEMAEEWPRLASQFPRLPKFKVHTDREFSTGDMPTRTGVYVPVDDLHGVLQFAWTGSKDGALGDCNTLSPTGQTILNRVGRQGMWVDEQAMARVVAPMYASGELTERSGFSVGAELEPDLVNGVISRVCFVDRPCKWYFVEKLDGQFEEPEPEQAGALLQSAERLRCAAGQSCPRAGTWSTPAATGSCHFNQGDLMPDMKSDYGQTIWYFETSSD